MIRAILFDLDGTLVDTEPLHFEAFQQTLLPLGISLARERYFSELIGYTDRDCIAAILRESNGDLAQLPALLAAKAALYQSMIAERDVFYPGAVDFARRCAARFPLLLVTGTLRVEAEALLTRAGLRDCFLDLIAAEDVVNGKPAPDGYLAALGRLGFILRPRPSIRAEECLAIEDTAAGVEAARAAGMRTLGLAQTAPASELHGADFVRASLAATDLDELLRALAA